MKKGIVLSGTDQYIETKAKNLGLGIVIDPKMPIAFEKVLFVDPGIKIPWDLLPAAWHFLDRWDAAVPLWRYEVNASGVGSKGERKQTQNIVRDLRVLLHSVELLFIRDNEDGRALMDVYRKETGEKRLAFLRAMYLVKPKVCVLPVTWLAEVSQRSSQNARAVGGRHSSRPTGKPLVKVEISPGRFVQCYAGDEEKVKADFEKRAGRSRGGRRRR